MSEETRKRWPAFVYAEGEEPDYRFSFANERTFLAWIRTALALLAAGVALDVVDLPLGDNLQTGLALALIVLGLFCTAAAWLRWAFAERAMRGRRPLPSFGLALPVTFGLVIVAVAVAVALGRAL
ncbi:YidH family protein [Nocardioides campestrisoli]|uniref:YidH family protein n=1 Tax=Nocardioides campestrisoli TaxID=2736757 RepID=UPI00163DC603|nr:DUF202 domain-containing protein [Nocardioides campestrisoli]